MKVFEFRFRLTVNDGFNCGVLENELKRLLEDMGNNLLDYSYKKDGCKETS